MTPIDSVSIITQNNAMLELIKRINKVADSDVSILLIGETGVGKEIFTDYIHKLSNRGRNPLVKIGLATLPPELMESELFGFEKGSFTSAIHSKKGMFELANKGTLLLDDIDDTPLGVQAKLLRAIEAQEIRHIGDIKPIPIDVRLICASKYEISDLIEKNLFRQDLYYRINVVELRIPTLRERKEDIPLLVNHFLKRFASEKQLTVAKDVMDILIDYDWPGNVRELRNVMQRSSLFAEKQIQIADLPDRFRNINYTDNIIKSCSICFDLGEMKYNELINCIETKLLSDALSRCGGNKSSAAETLGLKLSTFRDKAKKLNLP